MESQTPSISVVIPVYNGEAVIAETLDSVRDQSYDNVEIIVVNDSSTDRTKEICERPDVKLINLDENAGPANARNIGVGEATGEIILFIDTGVALDEPDTLSKLSWKFVERPDIAGVVMIRNKKALNPGLTPKFWAMINYFEWLRAPEYHTSFATERSAVRASVIQGMKLFDGDYKAADVEDHEFGFRLHEMGHKILVAHEIIVSDRFDTLRQATKKLLRRSFYWFRLFTKRKQFDTVWNTKDRATKTLLGGVTLPVLLISLVVLHPLLFAVCILVFLGYLRYCYQFYIWVGCSEGKPYLVFPFVFLELYFSSIILAGATWSLIDLLLHRNPAQTSN